MKARVVSSVWILLLLFSTSGCGVVRSIWGEKPAPPPLLELRPEKATACPAMAEILSSEADERALSVLRCWREELSKIWSQVETADKDCLQQVEVVRLVQSGAVGFPGSPNEAPARIAAAFELLGFGAALERAELERVFDWFETQLSQIRSVWTSLAAGSGGGFGGMAALRLSASGVSEQWVRLASSFLELLNWSPDLDGTRLVAHLGALRVFSDDLLVRVAAGLKLLDLQEGPIARNLRKRLDWLETQGPVIRAISRKILRPEERFRLADLELAFHAMGSFFGELSWKMSSADMASVVHILLGPKGAQVSRSLYPGMRAALSGIRFLCPIEASADTWVAQEFSACFEEAASHFSGRGALWFDYVVNEKDHVTTPEDRKLLHASLREFGEALQSWFKDPRLQGIETRTWIELVESFGVKPPPELFHSLSFLPRLNPKSRSDFLHPSAMLRLVGMLSRYSADMLDGMPAFVEAHLRGECVNGPVASWHDCRVNLLPYRLKQSKSLAFYNKIRSDRYGTEATPPTGGRFSKAMLFSTLAREIVAMYDRDGDGLITSTGLGADVEYMPLLMMGFQTVSLVDQFVVNLRRRLRDLPPLENRPPPRLRHLNLEGLAQLATLAGSEVLVRRSTAERNGFFDLIDNVGRVAPRSSVHMDHAALAAVIVFMESFGEYQDAYFKIIKRSVPGFRGGTRQLVDHPLSGERRVRREAVLASLRDILAEIFPRTYQSCVAWKGGFDRSCAITFEELIVAPDPATGMLFESDLNLITIAGAVMEGVVDYCDETNDTVLTADFFDGSDELDCAFTRFSDIAHRLFESKLLKSSGGESSKWISDVFEALDVIFLFRVFGKVPIAAGNVDIVAASPFLSFFHGRATLGSMYSLLSQILNREAADRADDERDRRERAVRRISGR